MKINYERTYLYSQLMFSKQINQNSYSNKKEILKEKENIRKVTKVESKTLGAYFDAYQ